jgi:hypothetical protein
MYAEQASGQKPMQTLFSSKKTTLPPSTQQVQRTTPIVRRPVRSAALEERDSVRTKRWWS